MPWRLSICPRMTGMIIAPGHWQGWLTHLADNHKTICFKAFGIVKAKTWDLGRRRLDEHMMHFIIKGGQEGTVAGTPVRTVAHDLLWLPPGTDQELRLARTERCLCKYFLRFTLDGEPPPPTGPPWRLNLPALQELVALLHDELSSGLPARQERVRALLVLLCSAWLRAARPAGLVFSDTERARILALVDGDPTLRHSPADLARAIGLGPLAFARRFRRSFGRSPRSWLLEHRIRSAAQRLLEDRRGIGAVASDYGYLSPYLFSRQFSQVMGLSPRAWRLGLAGSIRAGA